MDKNDKEKILALVKDAQKLTSDLRDWLREQIDELEDFAESCDEGALSLEDALSQFV